MNSNPEFVGETARQIAFVSAFLEGFAATFLGRCFNPKVPGVTLAGRRAPPLSHLLRSCLLRSAGRWSATLGPSARKGFAAPEFVP